MRNPVEQFDFYAPPRCEQGGAPWVEVPGLMKISNTLMCTFRKDKRDTQKKESKSRAWGKGIKLDRLRDICTTIIHYIIWYIIWYISLHFITFRYISLHFITFHYISLYIFIHYICYISFHYITFHYISLHYISIHFYTFMILVTNLITYANWWKISDKAFYNRLRLRAARRPCSSPGPPCPSACYMDVTLP